jgi:hypothetical protein
MERQRTTKICHHIGLVESGPKSMGGSTSKQVPTTHPLRKG